MKRYFLSLLLFMLCLTDHAQNNYTVDTTAQPKGVLLEEFTGIRCQYCPEGHKMGERLKTILGDQLSIIAIHYGPFAATGNANIDYQVEAGREIGDYLGSSNHGFPNGSVNRHNWNHDPEYASGRFNWTTQAKQASKEVAQVNLWAQAEYDAQNRKMDIKIEGYFTKRHVGDTQRLHIMLTQDHVMGPQSGSDYSTYEHQHMLRTAINGTWGEKLESCQPESFFTRCYSYYVPDKIEAIPVQAEDLNVVIFVTEEDGKHVKNVITVKPIYKGVDSTLKGVIHPEKIGITDNYQFHFVPVILENQSNHTLKSAKFSIMLNEEYAEQEWTGQIPAFGSCEIHIPIHWTHLKSRQNESQITLLELNGQSVEPSALRSFFDYSPLCLPSELIMKHNTTPEAQYNTYTLYDWDGNVVQEFGPYDNEKYYEEKLHLEPGHQYCLEVTNKWGEGYIPVKNFLELSDTTGFSRLVRDKILDFGFRIFFTTEGTSQPETTTKMKVMVYGKGTISVDNEEVNNEKVFTFPINKKVEINLLPAPNHKTSAFSVNGKDCLDKIVDNIYMLNMNTNQIVEVTFTPIETGIEEATRNGICLNCNRGQVRIEGLSVGKYVKVYTLEGKLILRSLASSNTLILKLPQGQSYIINIDGMNFKVVL